MDEFDAPFIFERAELIFAIGSSFFLLAACTEFLGNPPSPYGKIVGITGALLTSYLLITASENAVENIHHTTIQLGILETDPLRFLFGFVLVLLSALAILFSYLYMLIQERKGLLRLSPELSKTVFLSIAALVVFAIFEGFNSENDLFVAMRGISLVLFLAIPAYAIYFGKPGLQEILVVNLKTGMLVFAYDFVSRQPVGSKGLDNVQEARWINTASFLTALSSFSEEQLGSLSRLATDRLSLAVAQSGNVLTALQSISYSGALEENLTKFAITARAELDKIIPNWEDIIMDSSEIQFLAKAIDEEFAIFY
ncbi:MAG: hypothetical protein ACE5OZ_06585 [Candidatus Heimdallarchaeota archaeon]